ARSTQTHTFRRPQGGHTGPERPLRWPCDLAGPHGLPRGSALFGAREHRVEVPNAVLGSVVHPLERLPDRVAHTLRGHLDDHGEAEESGFLFRDLAPRPATVTCQDLADVAAEPEKGLGDLVAGHAVRTETFDDLIDIRETVRRVIKVDAA